MALPAEIVSFRPISFNVLPASAICGSGESVLSPSINFVLSGVAGLLIMRISICSTIKSGLFQRALERKGIESVIPDKTSQRKLMDIIYLDIKADRL